MPLRGTGKFALAIIESTKKMVAISNFFTCGASNGFAWAFLVMDSRCPRMVSLRALNSTFSPPALRAMRLSMQMY